MHKPCTTPTGKMVNRQTVDRPSLSYLNQITSQIHPTEHTRKRTEDFLIFRLWLPASQHLLAAFGSPATQQWHDRSLFLEKLMKKPMQVFWLAAMMMIFVSSLAAQAYYVSPNGSDSNNGTSTATPWQSISKVNSFVFPQGSSVSFQGGQTFTGCLVFNTTNVPASSASTPFTVK